MLILRNETALNMKGIIVFIGTPRKFFSQDHYSEQQEGNLIENFDEKDVALK